MSEVSYSTKAVSDDARKETKVNVNAGAYAAWTRARSLAADPKPSDHDTIVALFNEAIDGGIATAGTDLGRYLVRVSDARTATLASALHALAKAATAGGHSDQLAFVRAVHVLPEAVAAPHHVAAAAILNTLLSSSPNVETMVLTARMLASGHGYAKNPARARDMMNAAANAGSADAHFEMYVYETTGFGGPADEVSATRHLRQAAKSGNARAMANLAGAYATGNGVPHNDAKALTWYERACEAGSVRAANTLSAMYASGQGVTADAPRRAYYARLAHHLSTQPPTF